MHPMAPENNTPFFISSLLVSLTVAVCSGNSNLGSAAASSQTKSYTKQTRTECYSRVWTRTSEAVKLFRLWSFPEFWISLRAFRFAEYICLIRQVRIDNCQSSQDPTNRSWRKSKEANRFLAHLGPPIDQIMGANRSAIPLLSLTLQHLCVWLFLRHAIPALYRMSCVD